MSHWQGSVLTAAGRVLQAKVETGTTLELTRIKLGDGTEAMSTVDTLTDLVSPKAVLGVSSAVVDGQDAIITGVMSASHLSAGFYCREWGLFARDPDVGEILYMVTIDDIPEWLPASTQAAQVAATYAMNIAVANATNIEVNIDPAGLVDVDMLNEILGVAERSKVYSVGYLASMSGLPAEHYLRCITAGTTGANTPVLPANIKDGDKITDGTVMWQVTKAMSAAELGYRQPNTAYTAGQIAYHSALPTGYYLECTTEGITDSGALTIGTTTIGTTVSDGTAVWTIICRFGNQIALGFDDCNDMLKTGIYSIYRSTRNAPSDDWWTNIVFGNNDRTNNKSIQFCYDYLGTLYKRSVNNADAWTPWQQIDTIVAKSFSGNLYGGSGYIKYASGLIVQYGSLPLPSPGADNTYAVPMPLSFSTVHNIIVSSGGTGNVATFEVYSASGNTLYVKSTNATSGNTIIRWWAIGV